MAAEKRKLMVEIEKCFKKIDEGLELFEDMIKKMNEASADNIKEKCQEDLKKEIKKLQRLRDQVKNWQGSHEIKDKEKLNMYRRLIETKMELFKDIERENKTKPHSKIGLSIEEKVDPKEREKADVIEWLKAKIRSIQDEIDKTESKLEVLSGENSGEKKKKSKKNGKRNGCDDEVDVLKAHLERVNFHMDNLEVCMRLLLNEKLRYEDVKDKLMEALDMYVDALDPESDENPLDLEPDDIYEELGLSEYIDQLGKVNLPPIEEDKARALIEAERTRPKDIQKPSSVSKPTTGSMPHIPSTPKSSVGSNHSLLEPTPPKASGSSLPSATQMRYNAVVKVANASSASTSPLKIPPESPRLQSSLCRSDDVLALSDSSLFSNSSKALPLNNNSIESKPEAKENVDPKADSFCSSRSFPRHEDYYEAYLSPLDQLVPPLPSPGLGQSFDCFNSRLTPRIIKPPPVVKINPFSAYGISTDARVSEGMRKVTRCIEHASKNIPIPVDHLRARNYLPDHKSTECSPLWGMKVVDRMDTVEYYTKLNKETLFFVFYYMEGTFAQSLAAKALKIQSWRFHKKFLMWFQRERDPRIMTTEYEIGSYLFFDYEKWVIRSRDNFTFEYKYLEQRPID